MTSLSRGALQCHRAFPTRRSSHLETGAVVRLLGHCNYGNGSLTLASGLTNNGIIELSNDGCYPAVLTLLSGLLYNTSGRELKLLAGNGANRSLSAPIINEGMVNVS